MAERQTPISHAAGLRRRALRRSGPLGFVASALTLALGLAFGTGEPGAAAPAGSLLVRETTLQMPRAPSAVAINADESMFAVGEAGSGDTLTVRIYDRRSQSLLGRLASQAGPEPRLAFAPGGELLVVAGSAGVELWEVPIEPLNPESELGEKYLRWRVELPDDGPIKQIAFAPTGDEVVWAVADSIFRRSVTRNSPFEGQPAWQVEKGQRELAGFAVGNSKVLAVHYGGSKAIDLIGGEPPDKIGELAGHRFPVVAAKFSRGGALVSLDSGPTLIRWSADRQAETVGFLGLKPEAFRPTDLMPMAGPYFLLTSDDKGGGKIFDLDTRAFAANIPGGRPGPIAVSPTGRYLLVVAGESLHLYRFARPLAPRAYVRALKAMGAIRTARTYLNMLDETGLAPGAKSLALAELNRPTAGRILGNLLARLATAEREADLDEIIRAANQVLAFDRENATARAALASARGTRDGRVVIQAQQALDSGQHRLAISILSSRIGPESSRYIHAQEMIRKAEAARAIEIALEQAREKMNLGLYQAAQAVVAEVLRREKRNPAALALRKEIQHREGGTLFTVPWSYLIAFLLALLATAASLFRLRGYWMPIFRGLSLSESEPLPRSPGKVGVAAAGGGRATAGRSAPKRAAAALRSQGEEREHRRIVEELFRKVEELIRVSRQADITGHHTSYLLELEAELSAATQRLMDRAVDLAGMGLRLEEMIAHLRKLKFSKEPLRLAERKETLYDVLDLSTDSSPAEIKTAYHKLLKEYHPDLHSSSSFEWIKEEAEMKSRRIGEAYEVLSNAQKRELYDRELHQKRGLAK